MTRTKLFVLLPRKLSRESTDKRRPKAKGQPGTLADSPAVVSFADESCLLLSEHGNVMDIAGKCGGVDKLREAIVELRTLLYAAA
jgi:hypothetical protein